MKYNFEEYLPRRKTLGISTDVIHITGRSITIGYDIAVKYKGYLENGSEDDRGRMMGTIRFGIQHDAGNNVLRLYPSKMGYAFSRSRTSIRFTNTDNRMRNKTMNSTLHGKIKPGTYRLVPDTTDIYGLEE